MKSILFTFLLPLAASATTSPTYKCAVVLNVPSSQGETLVTKSNIMTFRTNPAVLIDQAWGYYVSTDGRTPARYSLVESADPNDPDIGPLFSHKDMNGHPMKDGLYTVMLVGSDVSKPSWSFRGDEDFAEAVDTDLPGSSLKGQLVMTCVRD